jgi:hypothetical protein
MNVAREICQRKARAARFLIVLFVLGVASSSVIGKQQIFVFMGAKPQVKQEAPDRAPSKTTPSAKENIGFKLRIIGDGNLCPMKDLDCSDKQIWFKRFTLLASDGNTLSLTSIPFPSIERSKERFGSSVKEADKILRRSSELNSKGESVGERALGLFQERKDMKPLSGVSHYKLFWMWSAHYWEISGEHLEDVLALEEKLKEQGINAVWSWR